MNDCDNNTLPPLLTPHEFQIHLQRGVPRECHHLRIRLEGIREFDLGMLRQLPDSIRRLDIFDTEGVAISGSFASDSLQGLGWHLRYSDKPLNASEFPCLKRLSFDSSGCISNLNQLIQLEYLYVDDPDQQLILDMALLPKLQVIRMDNCRRVRDICPLAHSSNLLSIELHRVRAVVDCRIFKLLPDLENFDISSSKNFQYVEMLRDCRKLRRLAIDECGVFDSIGFLSHLENLEIFWFSGGVIADGNLSPLRKLPKLRGVHVQRKKKGFYNPDPSIFPRDFEFKLSSV